MPTNLTVPTKGIRVVSGIRVNEEGAVHDKALDPPDSRRTLREVARRVKAAEGSRTNLPYHVRWVGGSSTGLPPNKMLIQATSSGTYLITLRRSVREISFFYVATPDLEKWRITKKTPRH